MRLPSGDTKGLLLSSGCSLKPRPNTFRLPICISSTSSFCTRQTTSSFVSIGYLETRTATTREILNTHLSERNWIHHTQLQFIFFQNIRFCTTIPSNASSKRDGRNRLSKHSGFPPQHPMTIHHPQELSTIGPPAPVDKTPTLTGNHRKQAVRPHHHDPINHLFGTWKENIRTGTQSTSPSHLHRFLMLHPYRHSTSTYCTAHFICSAQISPQHPLLDFLCTHFRH